VKGVVLKALKESKSLTVEDLKTYLNSNKDSMKSQKAALNTYWSKTSSAVRMLQEPGKPESSRFSFKTGTWNTRMCAAFMCSSLMVPKLCFSKIDLFDLILVLSLGFLYPTLVLQY
jgi:hypothetical protein